MLSANYTDDQYSVIVDNSTLDVLREVFNQADPHGDLIVKRSEILNELKVQEGHPARSDG
jgi:arginine/ornithine N-succinyltransferase beta subunit